MICKEDVISWFKELESYRRLDTMCTLLHMCLPFELRFLGTCLEELGRRDSQELRGIELRVNNPQELAADIASCQSGEPTDMKIRRKMALYLALIRACNRTCVNELFKTLDNWGERDFYKINDADALQELLLVYTMATNHPVFSFEQRMKCGEIFSKLKQQQQQMQSIAQHHYHQQQQHDHQQHSHQQQSSAAMHLHTGGGHQPIQTQIQVIPQGNLPIGFSQGHLTQIIPADANLQHQISVDGVHHMIPTNMAIPSDFSVGHPNTLTWTLRPNVQSYPPPPNLELNPILLQQQHPPQSQSPLLSQQSSPSHSRTASPARSATLTQCNFIQQQSQQGQLQQQQLRNPQQRGVQLRNTRRPSAETTPPPSIQQQQQLISLIGNTDGILPPNLKSLDEVVVNVDGAITPLQTLCRNGYTTRSNHHTIPRQSKSSVHLHHNQQLQQQQHSNQHFQVISTNLSGNNSGNNGGGSGVPSPMQPPTGTNFGVNTGLTFTLQNMSLMDIHNPVIENNMIANRHKNAGGGGSDSGSSIGSVGDITPPDTPSLVGSSSNNNIRISEQNNFNKQQQMNRLNGRPDKLLAGGIGNLMNPGGGGGGSNRDNSNVSITGGTGTTTVIYAPSGNSSQQQQQFISNELILTTAGPNLMPSPIGNNSNTNNLISSSSVNSNSSNSNNNNLVTNTVLITSPSTISGPGGGINVVSGTVLSTNSVLLQQQQQQQQSQQFSATYPYHAQHLAAVAAAAASTTRPPQIIPHNPTIAPPPGTFRHPGFQIQPNGDVLYPYPPQVAASGLTFLPPTATTVGMAAPPQAVVVRSSPSSMPPQQQQQQQQQSQQTTVSIGSQQQQIQQPPSQHSQQPLPSNLLSAASPYTTLTVGNKIMSCFNCGSQSHTGRECQEASMEDVTRGAVYKLDYTTQQTVSGGVNNSNLSSSGVTGSNSNYSGNTINSSSSSSSSNNNNNNNSSSSNSGITNPNNVSNNTGSGGNSTSNNNSNINLTGGTGIATAEIATETSSSTSSSSSLSNINTK